MKIDQLPLDTVAAKKLAAAQKSAEGNPAVQAPAAQTAQVAQAGGVPVTVSTHTRKLVASSGSGPVDEKKVEEVRDQIRNGTFKVDADKIADQLLSDAQSLLSDARKSS